MQIKRITDSENAFLNLFYVQNLSTEQIAHKTNMHPKFVERRKKEILKKLETN